MRMRLTSILLQRLLVVFLLCIFSLNLLSQETSGSKKKIQKLAREYFNSEEFEKALPLFLKLDTLIPNNFEIKYNIGACYLNTAFEKTKGIPYLEYALENGGNLLPPTVLFDLGTLYHLNYQFEEAESQFKKYLSAANKTDLYITKATRMIEVCNFAKELYNNPVDFDIFPVGTPVNTENSESTPLISADEEVIYFTRSFSKLYGQIEIEFLKKIYFSIYKNRKWQDPIEVAIPDIPSGMPITLAGSSPDGELLFFSIGDNVSSDIYMCQTINGICNELIKLPPTINSPFWEGKISITPDGQELYFSSNRPGGYGGKDIYRCKKQKNGQWSSALNLGPAINSEHDEDAPFIHPDMKTLYFSSSGHQTLGGYDVFSASQTENENDWTEPTNLGYPLNTTSDDIGFVITADGNNAFLASSHDNQFGKYDIYKVVLHKTIPLTLIKGTIKGGNPPKPIKARIKVVDHETREKLKYIYNPNPKTGKYLMIFPPNKNYDMVIEAEGYYPQLVNIYVPNQTYFYELFQEIFLNQIRVTQNDSIIGQEITVTNTFYDIYKTQISDSIYRANEQIKKRKFDDLLKVVEEIINTTDSIGLDKLDSISNKYSEKIPEKNEFQENKNYDKLINIIEDAINSEDSLSLFLLDANAIYNDVTNKTFFFDADSKNSNLVPVIFGNDTLYTLPLLNTSQKEKTNELKNSSSLNSEKYNKLSDFKEIPDSLRRYVYINYIFYESGKTKINTKYFQMLNGVIQLLQLNENLGVELHGYTDYIGDSESNFELSKNRAFDVMEFIVSKQIDSKRIIMSGHGESNISKDITPDLAQQRRVEIKVFEAKENQ